MGVPALRGTLARNYLGIATCGPPACGRPCRRCAGSFFRGEHRDKGEEVREEAVHDAQHAPPGNPSGAASIGDVYFRSVRFGRPMRLYIMPAPSEPGLTVCFATTPPQEGKRDARTLRSCRRSRPLRRVRRRSRPPRRGPPIFGRHVRRRLHAPRMVLCRRGARWTGRKDRLLDAARDGGAPRAGSVRRPMGGGPPGDGRAAPRARAGGGPRAGRRGDRTRPRRPADAAPIPAPSRRTDRVARGRRVLHEARDGTLRVAGRKASRRDGSAVSFRTSEEVGEAAFVDALVRSPRGRWTARSGRSAEASARRARRETSSKTRAG